ncbi:MAG: hypothetical protein NC548_29380 [Lachnospiraceae bacterium]|nr:hypothetical protein [Lachnospiraceae bacterium]
MGIISLYSRLYGDKLIKQPEVVTSPEEINESVPILEDAKDITLAQYSKYTQDVLTAHKIKDYRRKRFNLVLLPKVTVTFDRILEGSEYWNALLHNESPYS